MHLIFRRISDRLRAEDGYTLVAVTGITAAAMALSVATFASTGGDVPLGAGDKERKQAYAAAEAGVADYLARLTAKPDYWRACATDPANPSLNLAGATPRKWAPMGVGSTSSYSVEILPANDKPQCATSDPVGTFIDASTGTFRIRSTGRVRDGSGQRRSVIATFRRRGFLDYIYYTDFETSDPQWLRRDTGGRETREDQRPGSPAPERRSVEKWATEECRYWNEGRGSKVFAGQGADSGMLTGTNRANPDSWTPWGPSGADCGEIRFVTGDQVKGPLHTNDHLLLCGSPKFGRSASDDIAVSGTINGTTYRQDGGCSGAPVVNAPGGTATDRGTLRPNAPRVELPPSNGSLRDEAMPGYRFVGKTTIVLAGDTMTVQSTSESGTPVNKSMPLPREGVIFVSDSSTQPCPRYDPLNPYAPAPGCGDVWVSGTYSRSVTINADNDIVVRGNITASGTEKPLLGLISNNWIRVYHPTITDSDGCRNSPDSPRDIRIEAAILSVNHSFAVDNYWCGAKLGNLYVNGAIAQKYRGIVGSGASGYFKDYNYNEDLRFRSPPRFLDPVQSTWRLRSQVEQVPAAQ